MSDANGDNEYKIDDLVWAKMKGCSPWPGKVTEPTENMKKPGKKHFRWIFFFGSNNYAWINVDCLKPYHDFKDSLSNYCKTASFKEACKAIEAYIQNNIQSNPSSSIQNKSVKKRSNDSLISEVNSKKEKRTSVTNSTATLTNNELVNSCKSPAPRNDTFKDGPESTPDVSNKTSRSSLKRNFIKACDLTFGFIGLDNIGSGIVMNLLSSGHKVVVWNHTSNKIHIIEEAGAMIASTPSEVMKDADITFSCVTDPVAVKEIMFGSCGILSTVKVGKAYVEMTSIDPDTSIDVANSIRAKDGLYLEAMIQGSKIEAENGNLVILAAGNKTVLNNCESAFYAMANNVLYLGDEIGRACKMNLILHSIKAVSLAGLAEGMAIADKSGLSQKDLLDLLELTPLNSPLIREQKRALMNSDFTSNNALKLLCKDVLMTVQLSNSVNQPCPVHSSLNEAFKYAKNLGYGDNDAISLYVGAKF